MAGRGFAHSVFDEDKLVGECVSEVIGAVLHEFSEKVDENYVSTLDVPYATEMCMMKMAKILDLAVLEHDGEYADEEPLEMFTPDGEPMPSKIDSWARGTVTVKKIAADEHHGIPHSFSNETPSLSSGYTSNTGRGSSRASSRASSRNRGTTPMKALSEDKTGQIIELDEEADGDFANLSATGYMFDMLQKTKRKKESGYDVDEEKEKGEFALMQEQLEKANKDLRGKQFVLDRYGKPVLVGAIHADKLEPLQPQVGLNIVDPLRRENGENISTSSSRSGSRMSKQSQEREASGVGGGGEKKKKKKIRVAGSRQVSVDETAFKPTLSLAVSLSGVESVPKLNPGVTIRSHSSTRSGDKLPEDPKRMSRSQYLAQSSASRVAGEDSIGFGDDGTLETSSFYTNAQQQQQQQQQQSGASTGGAGSRGRTSRFGSRGVVGSGLVAAMPNNDSTATGSVTALKSLDSLPDYDHLEGSRLLEDANALVDASDEELGLGEHHGGAGEVSPTRLAGKQSAQQKANIDLISGSPENGKPRDRDMPKNMIHVAHRKHLPAPPLGHISGHGLSIDHFNKKNELSIKGGDNWTAGWRNA